MCSCALCNVVICDMFVVGGIYTVIRTKAAVTVEELGDRYFLIGPYNESCVRTELDIMEPPNEAVARAFQQMRDHGLKVCLCTTLHTYILQCLLSSISLADIYCKYGKFCL